MAKKMDNIQDAITRRDTNTTPTIERGSYGDRGVLEKNRPDGVGEASNEVDSMTPAFAPVVVVARDSPLAGHAAEIAGMLGPTATYSGHTGVHPSTGSPMPDRSTSEDFENKRGVAQQRG
jgi:hypothetical protein